MLQEMVHQLLTPERALEVFEAMQQQQGVMPDVITYSALTSACEKGKQPERALELFEARQLSVHVSFNAAIGACEKGKLREEALELLQEMMH